MAPPKVIEMDLSENNDARAGTSDNSPHLEDITGGIGDAVSSLASIPSLVKLAPFALDTTPGPDSTMGTVGNLLANNGEGLARSGAGLGAFLGATALARPSPLFASNLP